MFPIENDENKLYRVLIVSATMPEVEPLVRKGFILKSKANAYQVVLGDAPIEFWFLFTGIGAINTGIQLAGYLVFSDIFFYRPDLIINLGIAGSYNKEYHLGQVVEVTEDSYADLGAESPEQGFLDFKALDFPNFTINEPQIKNPKKTTEKTYYNTIATQYPDLFQDPKIPKVKGITVQTVRGTTESIKATQERWNPDIETMEGAAFFQTCIMYHTKFLAFRAISNYVTPRDKAKWKMKEAIHNLNNFATRFLDLDYIIELTKK